MAAKGEGGVAGDPAGAGQARGMNAHASAILLGVKDMATSKRFYSTGVGWKVEHDHGVSVFFVPHGDTQIGFYGHDGLAALVGVRPEGSGFAGMVLNYIVRSEARVDEILDLARKAGASVTKPAVKEKWGGYEGAFSDPDGYIWRVIFHAQAGDQAYSE